MSNRIELKASLAQCTEGQQHKFRRMYSFKNLKLSISEVIDNMPEEQLEWAQEQIYNTLLKETK